VMASDPRNDAAFEGLFYAALQGMRQADNIVNIDDRERAHGQQLLATLAAAREIALRRQSPGQTEMEAEPTAPQQPETQPSSVAADPARFDSAVPSTPPNAPVAAGATSPMAAESTAPAPAPSAAQPLSNRVGAAAEPQAAPEAAADFADAPVVATVVEPFDPASLDPNDENYLEKLKAECRKRNIEFESSDYAIELLRKLMRPPRAPPPLKTWTCADCGQPDSKCGRRHVLAGGAVVYHTGARTDEGPICRRCATRRRTSRPKLKNLRPLENCLSCTMALSNYRYDGPYGIRTDCFSCYKRREHELPPYPPLDKWFCTNCGRNYEEAKKIRDSPDGQWMICTACRSACDCGPEAFEARRNKQRVVTSEMHRDLQIAIDERELKLAELRANYSALNQEDAVAAAALVDAEAGNNEELARLCLDEDIARASRAAKASEGKGSDLEGAAESQTEIDHPQFRNVVEQRFMLKRIANSDVAKLSKAILTRLDFRDPKSSLFDKWVCPICLDRDCKEPQRVFVEGLLIPICEKCASAAAH
jgi:hypothetical protein